MQCPRPGDFEDHAAESDVDAHRAKKPVGQDGGRIGDAPSVGLDRAIDLALQARQRACAFRPRREKFFCEVRAGVW
jgi:hypothetical protein